MASPDALIDDSIVRDPTLSLFQKVLLTTDGTVTQLLELFTGAPIKVRKLEQGVVQGEQPQWLPTAAGERLLKRTILLCTEQQPMLYAESWFVIERMPPSMQQQLLHSDRPIGLLWREARMETYREIVAYQRQPGGLLSRHFGLDAEAELLARTYLIYHQHQPLGVITEKFPASYFQH